MHVYHADTRIDKYMHIGYACGHHQMRNTTTLNESKFPTLEIEPSFDIIDVERIFLR